MVGSGAVRQDNNVVYPLFHTLAARLPQNQKPYLNRSGLLILRL